MVTFEELLLLGWSVTLNVTEKRVVCNRHIGITVLVKSGSKMYVSEQHRGKREEGNSQRLFANVAFHHI